MKFQQWMTVFLLAGSLALVSCAKHKPDSTVSDDNAAYNDGAETSGMGGSSDSASFSDASDPMHRTYYFDFDSNVVHDNDRQAIVANANKLTSEAASKALVEGHTDPRGSREYNIALGERRAKAVASVLTAHGVSSSRVRVVSYGSQKPAVTGRSESDYQLDRRAVLVY